MSFAWLERWWNHRFGHIAPPSDKFFHYTKLLFLLLIDTPIHTLQSRLDKTDPSRKLKCNIGTCTFETLQPSALHQHISGKSRTSQDMDGALHTDFANFYTIWVSATKISAFLQLGKKCILTKFEECGSKIGSATPIWSFRRFWREIQIQGTKCLQIWFKEGTYWG